MPQQAASALHNGESGDEASSSTGCHNNNAVRPIIQQVGGRAASSAGRGVHRLEPAAFVQQQEFIEVKGVGGDEAARRRR